MRLSLESLYLRNVPKGFTLIELMVVVLIIGIVSMIGMVRYQKTIETQRADEAVQLLRTVYEANKAYLINNCPTNQNCWCPESFTFPGLHGDCNSSQGGEQSLLSLRYLPTDYNAPDRPYCYLPADSATALFFAACVKRRGGGLPYSTWSYAIRKNGELCYAPDDANRPPAQGAIPCTPGGITSACGCTYGI